MARRDRVVKVFDFGPMHAVIESGASPEPRPHTRLHLRATQDTLLLRAQASPFVVRLPDSRPNKHGRGDCSLPTSPQARSASRPSPSHGSRPRSAGRSGRSGAAGTGRRSRILAPPPRPPARSRGPRRAGPGGSRSRSRAAPRRRGNETGRHTRSPPGSLSRCFGGFFNIFILFHEGYTTDGFVRPLDFTEPYQSILW